MRGFIGIDLDKELKSDIKNIQDQLRKHAKKGRWKYVDNLHITLKFLEEVSLKQLEEIDKKMRNLVVGKKAFTLQISSLGTFSRKESIRVLWIGLDGNLSELNNLHMEIDEKISSLGFSKQKRSFKPHITIGQDLVFDRNFEEIKEEVGKINLSEIKVKNLYFYKSEQVGGKRIYTKIREYQLE